MVLYIPYVMLVVFRHILVRGATAILLEGLLNPTAISWVSEQLLALQDQFEDGDRSERQASIGQV
jgi:hypothetical protein